jgi:hypothetical protein
MTALSPFEGLNLDRLIERRQLDERAVGCRSLDMLSSWY